MKTKANSIPTTGQVLAFLVECFGTGKDKGVSRPEGVERGGGESDWAQYKRIERLVREKQQSDTVSRGVENALIDAVASVFDSTYKIGAVTSKMRKMNLGLRIQSVLSSSRAEIRPRFTNGLIFWIVYFIEHHEWLRPQLESAYSREQALREWINHAAHFYINTIADTCRANRWLFEQLPDDLNWNMPKMQSDGSIKWPICSAIEWLQTLLASSDLARLPYLLYPNPLKSSSLKSFNRLMRGSQLPNLENVGRWAEIPWRYKNSNPPINPEKLKAVFLWSRALQYSFKSVEKEFGLNKVCLLVDWHKKATESLLHRNAQESRKVSVKT